MLKPLSVRNLGLFLLILASFNLGACNALLRQSFERGNPTANAIPAEVPAVPPDQPVQANFYCQNTEGQWRTFVNLDGRKDQILVTWETTYFDLTPEERCFEVADRFNEFYPDRLQTLKAGELNNLGVLCVGACGNGDVLFTLPPETSAQDAYNQLEAMVRNAHTGQGQGIVNTDITYPGDGFAHLNFQFFLRRLSQGS
ncbi:MAG: COP23 domain-containing protein [Prochlorotrichaceae cyanobacterium]|jgi:hypothetical protein